MKSLESSMRELEIKGKTIYIYINFHTYGKTHTLNLKNKKNPNKKLPIKETKQIN